MHGYGSHPELEPVVLVEQSAADGGGRPQCRQPPFGLEMDGGAVVQNDTGVAILEMPELTEDQFAVPLKDVPVDPAQVVARHIAAEIVEFQAVAMRARIMKAFAAVQA